MIIHNKILEPIKDLSIDDQKQYYADIKVMNYILQGIPNDIYNSVDAFNDAQNMWNQIKRLMQPKKVSCNHDPLALVANSYAHPSHSHESPSYSRSPQPYYVTHPSSVIDYFDDCQGEIQGDAQEDKISTTMMLLARAITQHYSTPTNNRLRTSSNTRNQAVIQDGRVDIQSKNVGYSGNGKTNVQCYNCNGKGHYARECPKPRVRDAKYFREQMLLATKDEAGVNLDAEENGFMLMNAYGDDQLEELNASVIMMAHIQPTDDKSNTEPTYDAELISEVNATQIDLINGLLSKSDHEHKNHEKLETVIHTLANDQIDSNIIFDDPYRENNS
ncbi:integrase, catalytic region, zinc finger, CCHC-type containing protein [Tanacetum coccineum]